MNMFNTFYSSVPVCLPQPDDFSEAETAKTKENFPDTQRYVSTEISDCL